MKTNVDLGMGQKIVVRNFCLFRTNSNKQKKGFGFRVESAILTFKITCLASWHRPWRKPPCARTGVYICCFGLHLTPVAYGRAMSECGRPHKFFFTNALTFGHILDQLGGVWETLTSFFSASALTFGHMLDQLGSYEPIYILLYPLTPVPYRGHYISNQKTGCLWILVPRSIEATLASLLQGPWHQKQSKPSCPFLFSTDKL